MKIITMLRVLLGTHITARSILYGAKLSTSAARSAQNTKTIVVIGGGAAGYFSAIECAKLLSESQKKVKNSIRYEVGLHRSIQLVSTIKCNRVSDT
jgi:NADH dehydrogenase FAD-containing subunit